MGIRILRIFRILRYLNELRDIVHALVSLLGSLFWVCILLLGIMYVFALQFVQYATEHLGNSEIIESIRPDLNDMYSSLPRCIWSLYMCLIGGEVYKMFGPWVRLDDWLAFSLLVIYVTFGVL